MLAPPPTLTDGNQHTADHINCSACARLDSEVKIDLEGMADLPFGEANRSLSRFPKTSPPLEIAHPHFRSNPGQRLRKFFGKVCCKSILPGMLQAYQQARHDNQIYVGRELTRPWQRAANAQTINHELALLGRVLKACKLWVNIKPLYFPLEIPAWSPREILSEAEEEQFFRKAAGDAGSSLDYLVAVLTNKTTLSDMELRPLRLEHTFWAA